MNKRIQKKVDEYLTEVDSARSHLMAFIKENQELVDEYTETLLQYQAAVSLLKEYCSEHFDELEGEHIGPLLVTTMRKADPKALIDAIGLERANKFIQYKPTLNLTALEEGLRRGEIDEETIDTVCTYSPMIKGMPKISIDLKL